METLWNKRIKRRKKRIREKEKHNEWLIQDKTIRDVKTICEDFEEFRDLNI